MHWTRWSASTASKREAALALKGCDVAFPRSLPRRGPGKRPTWSLAWPTDGVVLGRVIEVAAHPLLRVARPGAAAAGERLIPYVAAVVDEVDLDAGRLRVDWGEDY
jgi:16S rRNA processing protein RimM